jgi:hypothetical protein
MVEDGGAATPRACAARRPVHAHADDALPFAKSYSITGNYVVGGVDPGAPTRDQRSGDRLHFDERRARQRGHPCRLLCWETISTQISQVDGAKFRGNPVTVVKATSARLDGDARRAGIRQRTASHYTLTMFRADVLRFLPLQKDSNGNITSKRLVNDSDLSSSEKLTVTLPESAVGTRAAERGRHASRDLPRPVAAAELDRHL